LRLRCCQTRRRQSRNGDKPMPTTTRIAAVLFLASLTLALVPLHCQSKTADAAATVTKLINDDIKASLAGDTNFVKTNYVDGYVEGRSFGTWIAKEQFLDTASNKVNSRNVSDLNVNVFGDTAIARFRETYDALVQGEQHKRTVICTQTWNKQAATWKVLATHCSQVH